MRFSILAILAIASAAFAFDFDAHPFDQAPHCARQCGERCIESSSCGSHSEDFGCFCRDDAFRAAAISCVKESCGFEEQLDSLVWAKTQCGHF
ncbi:hypothetical protein AOQ84DRAFT_230658 [Glonium stellatum]|uniref:CFEM domain-containing protein n=1 Tax=Glonium stellatum TaxID=574774 RepID=A0A8E2F4N2_9PEZI|nr:hypothetical protein AOQ84DRAFT_230658 [Glonium stellatum]